ncbi:MAG TPA: peptidylprolyl isomerase [Cytophagales bacterium]|nr:peptidylprolyl isomerase [Cytophagales bacterium]
MALIKKIRERTGIAVGVVAVALMLFMLGGDLLNQNSFLRGNSSQDVGEIAGENISIQEYQQEIDQWEQRYGGNVTEGQRESLREQAWESLIAKIAFTKEFEELGIEVPSEELSDLFGGANVDQNLKQAFTDPQTGEFNRVKLDSFFYRYNNNQMDPNQKAQVNKFLAEIRGARQRIKYENLILKTVYVTKAEAQREYENQTAKAEVKFLYVPFHSVSDSSIKVTDEQIREYINKNKEKYKGETSASIEYVTFPVKASSEDTAAILKEINELAEDFKNTAEDSTFSSINTEGQFSFDYVNPGELPALVASQISSLKEGDVVGPVLENGVYKLLKLSDVKTDADPSVRASHILFKPASTSDADQQAALKQAKEVLKQIKEGANFETMAMIHGTDGTKNQGGDLGWFSKGRMVPEFENAVFNFNGTGLLPEPVKTDFGYHIIKVTEPKSNVQYRFATIEKQITPGSATNDRVYRNASAFAGTVVSGEEFRTRAAQDSLTIMEAPRVTPTDRSINELLNTREIVRWIFNDAEAGAVSQVFSLEDSYVVVSVKSKFEEGEANIENLRNEITPKIENELKAKAIIAKLQGQKGTLEDIAKKYGSTASVNTQADITFTSSSLNNVGFSPIATGRIFGMKKGERSEPIADENGVLIVEVLNKTPAPEIADHSMYKDQIAQRRQQQASSNISETVKKYSDIEDNRTKFF